MADDPTIVFSVKELISRLDGKLDMMMKVLTDKADRADVNALDRRVGAVEVQVNDLVIQRKSEAKAEEDGTARGRFLITALMTVIGLLIALAAVVVTILVKG
jgi:hypothetical protein